jgi:hypothetical protein
VTVHDGTYSIDYEKYTYPRDVKSADSEPSSGITSGVDTPATDASISPSCVEPAEECTLAEFVSKKIKEYRHIHNYKIAGGAVTVQAERLCPELPSLLWCELDIVCFVFKPFNDDTSHDAPGGPEFKVDEESDSVARKAIE